MTAQSTEPAARPDRCAVVVLTFRPPSGLLEATVRSVLDESPDVDLIVVDNGDDAVRRLGAAQLLEPVTVVVSGDNLGYAGGMNRGIDVALARGADVVVLLNDDVFVGPGWLPPLLSAFVDGVGAVQPLLLQGEGAATDPERVNSAGVVIDRYGAGSDIGRGLLRDEIGENRHDIEVFTGGAVAVSRAFVEDVGHFDERFFLYYEDVELARRGRARGWRYVLAPSSTVWHLGSASTSSLGDDVRRLQERNRLWSSAMHGSMSELLSGFGLSLRRLRHRPRRVHARALGAGVAGVPRRLAGRVRRSVGGRRRVAVARRRAKRLAGTPGVNVVGYFHISSGLGAVARELTAALTAAGIPHVEIDNDLSTSPRRRTARAVPAELHDTTIAIVTAFEFAHFCHRFPQLVGPGRRMIGSWFWELSAVPEEHVAAAAHLDEVWAPTRFVQDAYRAALATDVPVRFAPFALPTPSVDTSLVAAWRARWGDATVFVVSFDHLSIVERKNPIGAISAFRRAFADDRHRVRLVVKSINGDQRPDGVEAIRAAVGEDDRIDLIDEHHSDEQHHAMIAAADCLVTLHRSEGYGLHPALAMALGTVVISTRYSGVLDFLDDSCAALVDAALVSVTNGQGIYPETAVWAEPDSDQAAAFMRRVVADDEWRERLVATARSRIHGQPTPAEFGEAYAALLRSPADGGTTGEPFFAGLDDARRSRRLGRRSLAWPDTARR